MAPHLFRLSSYPTFRGQAKCCVAGTQCSVWSSCAGCASRLSVSSGTSCVLRSSWRSRCSRSSNCAVHIRESVLGDPCCGSSGMYPSLSSFSCAMRRCLVWVINMSFCVLFAGGGMPACSSKFFSISLRMILSRVLVIWLPERDLCFLSTSIGSESQCSWSCLSVKYCPKW